MILPRLSFTHASLVFAGGLMLAGAAHAQRSDLLPVKAREAVVERAEALVRRSNAAPAQPPSDAVNPFVGVIKAEPVKVAARPSTAPARPEVSEDQRLKSLVPSINPTGTIALGGERYLLFGQKKLKVGEILPIVFEGATYEVVITDIQSTSFSIRLGAAELVRPIKPVIRP